MNILFVHQGFPGQYIHILRHLSKAGGHQLVGLGIAEPSLRIPKGVQYVRYIPSRSSGSDLHPLASDIETKVIRGEACARMAAQLRERGLRPDLICAHPGWGECLFLKDVFPDVPMLTYQEFFYRAHGLDLNFDPEFQGPLSWEDCARSRMKTGSMLLNLSASDWCVSPTHFQRDTFPARWHSKISVIHDGIDVERIHKLESSKTLQLPDGTVLHRGDPIVSFVNRRLEPYRGCHTFLRAIPQIQQLHPEARIVIVGELEGSSYGPKCPQGEWRELFLKEIEGHFDPSRVHFTGPLGYRPFLQLLQLSAIHVYLTYPFVLSWSLLEAMASGCAVVGSATGPVEEVIRHGHNGLLVDFFKPADLAVAVAELLADRPLAQRLGQAAKVDAVRDYSLSLCLPRQLALMQLVASRSITSQP